MTSNEFVNSILEIPEVMGLITCAQRSKLRFALRGGTLRNLLLRSQEVSHPSLYDFVDPFSDIDLVVETESDWALLVQMIAESIPFAGFHHWEAKTERAIHAASKSFGMIP